MISEHIARSWGQRQPSAPWKITFSRGPRNILIRPFSTLRASSGAVAADVLTKVLSPRRLPSLLRSHPLFSSFSVLSVETLCIELQPGRATLSLPPFLSLPIFLSRACFAAQQWGDLFYKHGISPARHCAVQRGRKMRENVGCERGRVRRVTRKSYGCRD